MVAELKHGVELEHDVDLDNAVELADVAKVAGFGDTAKLEGVDCSSFACAKEIKLFII